MEPRPECHLPELPLGIVPNVGYPTPESIMVSRTDFALMLEYVAALRDWIEAASECLR